MICKLWGYIVRIIHILFILFMIIIPFTNSKQLLLLHIILVPFLYFHWVTNNDTCALTEIEKYLCNKKVNTETFIGSIVSPIYKIENQASSNMTKITTLLLWCFSLQKI